MENTNSTTINKPVSLVLEESKQIIVNAINSVNLSPIFLEPMLKDIYNEVYQQKTIQYEREKAEYERALIEQKQIEMLEQQNKQIEESTEK